VVRLNRYIAIDQASGAELDETILVSHFKPDEDSPPDTSRPLSGVIKLYDTSTFFRYQLLQDEHFFLVETRLMERI
jgi:hypothetical protein